MLEGYGITYRYSRKSPPVIENVHIHVAPGEIVGLFGPSGRGKTTLARILSGYLTPQHGRVILNGDPLPQRGVSPVQLLFQHPELAVNPRWKIGRTVAEGRPPSPELLDAFEVRKRWFQRYPHELSGGELQRICAVRALSTEPSHIVADEMTAMLDAMTQARLWKALCRRAERERIGILAISHNQALLDRVCHRMAPCLA